MQLDIYTDGSCRGGHGGWAWVSVKNDEYFTSESGRAERTTHQQMEILAVIKALEYHGKNLQITIYSDSAYVVNCMNDKWYANWIKNGWMSAKGSQIKNMDLWERLISLLHDGLKFKHVKAHQFDSSNRTKFNNMADALAKH